jgi:general secretion pathway protein A
MYEQHFGLREKPFNLTPSPRFLYLSEEHKEAIALLKYGVLERKGFILLTGEVGTGKTTMIRVLLNSLDSSIMYVHLSNPLLSPHEFINYLAYSTFKKEGYINAKAKFLLTFQDFLKRCLKENKNFNLIIDEAHKLSFEVLEEIRLLSNMETGDQKLMNIFLVGQPELNEKLSEIKCRPLLQRISIRHHIPPLNSDETRAYMMTRLKIAGSSDIDDIFSNSAVKAIYQYSHGYPREINILADNVLLLGYSKGIKKVTSDMVKVSYEDLKLDHSLVQSHVRVSNSAKIKRIFSFPMRHWKAACFLLLVILIALFAPSRHGKEAFSKLKSLISLDYLDQYIGSSRVSIASEKFGSQRIKVVPDPNPSSPIAETNETNKTNQIDQTNQTIWKTITVKRGDTVSKLIDKVYGKAPPEYVEMVKEQNPEISDINAIEIGQTIVFPPLDGPIKKIEDSIQKTE